MISDKMRCDEPKRMQRRKLNQAGLDKAIEELVKKYGPKEIKRYDENGKTVRVFEARQAQGFDLFQRIK